MWRGRICAPRRDVYPGSIRSATSADVRPAAYRYRYAGLYAVSLACILAAGWIVLYATGTVGPTELPNAWVLIGLGVVFLLACLGAILATARDVAISAQRIVDGLQAQCRLLEEIRDSMSKPRTPVVK